MARWSELLLTPDDDVAAQPVQAPVQRPNAVARPSAQAGKAAPPQPQQRWSEVLTEPEDAPAPAALPQMDAEGVPEPDAPTWLGRRMQDLRGKQDPRYQDLPDIFSPELKQAIPNLKDRLPLAGSMLLAQSDDSLATLLKEQIGDRFLGLKKDANGYDVITYLDASGGQKSAYVNKPGLNIRDVARGVMGVIPFAAGGAGVQAAVKGAGLLPRAVAQAGGQMAVSGAQDATAELTGVGNFDFDYSLAKGIGAGAGGAVGEVAGAAIAPIIRKFVTEPGLIDSASGDLTRKGAQAARDAGLDPSAMSAQIKRLFAGEMGRTGDPNIAGTSAASRTFGIPRTQGEFTQNPGQLLREQQIRSDTYGVNPGARMREFDTAQKQAIESAVLGEIQPGRPGLAQQIAPGRGPVDYSKAEIGQAVRGNTQQALDAAKAVEREAWRDIPSMTATPEARSLLGGRLNEAIGDFPIPAGGKAEAMAKELDSFLQGKAPQQAASWIKSDPTGNVDQFRKRITNLYRSMDDPTDKAAAGRMLDAYNGWLREAAEQGLLQGGDAAAAAQLVKARGISREIHTAFDGQRGTPGARIMADVLKKADSAEGVVNALFTGPTAQIKNGTVSALQSLKQAYDQYLPPEAAKAAWEDVGLAYLLRMVQGKNGEMVGAQALQTNIKQALGTQSSVVRTLYGRETIGALQLFLKSIEGIEKKNLNRSWSGVSVAGYMRDMFNSLITAVGFSSLAAKAGANLLGAPLVKAAYGQAAVSKALSPVAPALAPPSFGGIGAGIGARSNE